MFALSKSFKIQYKVPHKFLLKQFKNIKDTNQYIISINLSLYFDEIE